MTLSARKLRSLRQRKYTKYEHILDLYHATRKHWEECKSRRGGYHISRLGPDGMTITAGQGQLKIRQYPLVAPGFSRTYIAMLPPTHLGASTLDSYFYGGQRLRVLPGRIAIYYAPNDWRGVRQSDGLEVLAWQPSGECIVNAAALGYQNLGALRRAETFANLCVFNYRLERWIRLSQSSQYRAVPAKKGEYGAYRRYDPEHKQPDVWVRWKRCLQGLYRWPGTQGIVIPKDRRAGMSGAAPSGSALGQPLSEWRVSDSSNKLQSYNQWVAERKSNAVTRRKLRNAVHAVIGKPELASYLANIFNDVLAREDMARVVTNSEGRVHEMRLEELLNSVPLAEEHQIPELDVGARQSRFLHFGEYISDS